jgi:cysteine desulfurase / selenocysteine lyase
MSPQRRPTAPHPERRAALRPSGSILNPVPVAPLLTHGRSGDNSRRPITTAELTRTMVTAIDVERARRETPGCAEVAHFNNAGAALPPQPVLDTVVEHLLRESRIGAYEASTEAADRLEAVYASLAWLIGCAPDEIAVVENATRAWDMAFYALPLGPGDRILTARAEYASNVIAFLQIARRRGVVIDVVPDDEHGQV